MGLAVLLLLLLRGAAAAASPAHAQTRRAVLVGINQYQLHPSGDRVGNLDGAVADAEAMAALLQTLHGFRAEEVLILRNQEASRAAILSAIEMHLERPAQPGDLSFFYYAGHGSYVDNPTSPENDKRDETIVPADSNSGAPDIRDKELALRLHRILDRQVQLVAIFDSCHSGSIARGLPELIKNRFAPPAPYMARGRDPEKLPSQDVEDRGALIWSAAQEHQPAQERSIRGQTRGRFTSALEYVLSGAYRDESVEKLHVRVRALMQSGGSVQEPVLGATRERRAKGLWGQPQSGGPPGAGPAVAVSRVSGARVYLQAGIASGIGIQAVLRKYREPHGARLRVVEVSGMASSVAEPLSGADTAISPGDLFEIESYGVPHGEGLKIFLPSPRPSAAELASAMKQWRALAADPVIRMVADPTEETPTHVIMWEEGGWRLREPSGAWLALGAQPDLSAVRKRLRGVAGARLFLNIPLNQDQAEELSRHLQSGRGFIQLVADAGSATYHLVGRLNPLGKSTKVEHALVLPSAQSSDRHIALPHRSGWIELTEERFMSRLVSDARRLNKMLLWRSLDSPPADETFPYKLAVVELQSKRVLAETEPLRVGRRYQLALFADAIGARPRPRYVYIFSLDREGSCELLVPASDSSNVENYVPDVRPGGDPAPKQVAVGGGFSVAPPLGRDTLILVTTATPIATPSAFCASSDERAGSTTAGDALTQFLFGLSRDTRTQSAVPGSWSVQRLTMDSVEK